MNGTGVRSVSVEGSDCCLCVLIRLLSVQIAASAQAVATEMPLADRCSMCFADCMFN